MENKTEMVMAFTEIFFRMKQDMDNKDLEIHKLNSELDKSKLIHEQDVTSIKSWASSHATLANKVVTLEAEINRLAEVLVSIGKKPRGEGTI